jgi:hypothetical protein
MTSRFAMAFSTLFLGLYFGFASSESYGQLIAGSAVFHTASLAWFLVLTRSKGWPRSLATVAIAANVLFLIELFARVWR